MSSSKTVRILLAALFAGLAVLTTAAPVQADGGPIVGSALWQFLKEGQQVAVITFSDTETATVDLFASMLDDSGESHEIVYFVPLGPEADDFNVYEQTAKNFNTNKTENLDRRLHEAAMRNQDTISALLGPSLLADGIFLLPAWVPLLLTGCGGNEPEATFSTESSQVDIYGLDETTDIDGLIATTGLDPAIRDTLSRYRGERIAVVTLQTRARNTGSGTNESGGYFEETGLHLQWRVQLEKDGDAGTYAYPLGTGSSWARPIEMTRIYVVAPASLDIDVRYPELGKNGSGYSGRRQRITSYVNEAAYAISDTRDSSGTVWRGIYTESNAAEDITVTVKPRSWLSGLVSHGTPESTMASFVIGLIIILALWLLAWRFLMPRLAGIPSESAGWLWRHGLVHILVNMVLMIPGLILYVIWMWTGSYVTMVILFILLGAAAVIVFSVHDIRWLNRNTGTAVRAFAMTILAVNGVYYLLILGYAALTGIL